jgi:conjugal transfer mating pair stabilization protein TraN
MEKRESYCCFESPLPRIIMEQAREQFDGVEGTFGDPEFPNCEGLTMTQLGSIDWDQIDLSEWMGLLQTTGNMPSASDYDLSMDGLTGTGSALNLHHEDAQELNEGEVTIDGATYEYEFQPRSDVKTRTDRRLEGVPVEDNNQDLRQGMWEQKPTILDP